MKIEGRRIVSCGIGPNRSIVGIYKDGSRSRALTAKEINDLKKYKVDV